MQLIHLHQHLHQPLHPATRLVRRRLRQRGERGDIPGWVLVTVMTITIGMALWGIAQPQLAAMLRNALASVG
ncbi:hypothetical protein [Nocardioides sp. SYSU DS0651]|uniref:hypothetical protein n=1 Tax=Nocardioides sp. SYSU DS0651 TaxID=3415955 RepID=UPI003F4B640E